MAATIKKKKEQTGPVWNGHKFIGLPVVKPDPKIIKKTHDSKELEEIAKDLGELAQIFVEKATQEGAAAARLRGQIVNIQKQVDIHDQNAHKLRNEAATKLHRAEALKNKVKEIGKGIEVALAPAPKAPQEKPKPDYKPSPVVSPSGDVWNGLKWDKKAVVDGKKDNKIEELEEKLAQAFKDMTAIGNTLKTTEDKLAAADENIKAGNEALESLREHNEKLSLALEKSEDAPSSAEGAPSGDKGATDPPEKSGKDQ